MGLLTLRGALGGLESLPHCLLSLSFWPCRLALRCQPRPFLQGSLHYTQLSPDLPPVACWEAACRVSAFAGVLRHRNITWGPKRGRQKSQDAQTLSELVFHLQKCSEITADPAPFAKCPTDEPSRLPSSFPVTPAVVLSEYSLHWATF